MKRMTPSVLGAMALVSALALVACSSDDPTDPGDGNGNGNGNGGGNGGGNGSFNASVTGGVTASFSGPAVQAEVDDIGTGQLGWTLSLGGFNVPAANLIGVSLHGSRPGPGTYQLINLLTAADFLPGEWFAILILGDGTNETYGGFSVSGTFTITSSSADLVAGTFNFQVSDGNIPPVVATVTGTFSAVNANVTLPASKIQRRSSAFSPQP